MKYFDDMSDHVKMMQSLLPPLREFGFIEGLFFKFII
jgi:hypothetical protein